MSSIEFFLAAALNVQWIFVVMAFITTAAWVIGLICMMAMSDEDSGASEADKAVARRIVVTGLILWFPSVLLTSVPDVNDLWRVRIGMIKLQLASPENVEKGAQEIIRIGKKLECRYLGCPEEKASANKEASKN